MQFDKLHSDSLSCDCIKIYHAKENTEDTFLRLTNSDKFSEKDFISAWDEGTTTKDGDCKRKCSKKGVSVFLTKESTFESTLADIRSMIKSSPYLRAKGISHYHFIKFGKDCGKVGELEKNNHCNFFKCDDFKITKIERIDCKPL